MPSPAIVISMISLLVATGGTAWGVGAVSKRSSHTTAPTGRCDVFRYSNPACHFPAWDSRDIVNNTLRGVDIKNGSLGAGDLSAGARAALKGQRGNPGTNGTNGANGVNGTNGAPGPPGFSKLIYRSSGDLTNSASSVQFGFAPCDANYFPIGGGADTESGKQFMNASYAGFSDGSHGKGGWVTWIANTDTVAHLASIWVICAPAAETGKTSGAEGVGHAGASPAQAMRAK